MDSGPQRFLLMPSFPYSVPRLRIAQLDMSRLVGVWKVRLEVTRRGIERIITDFSEMCDPALILMICRIKSMQEPTKDSVDPTQDSNQRAVLM